MNKANEVVEVNEPETPFHLLPQEEQQRIIAANQQKVREAPTLHEWDIRVPTPFAWQVILMNMSFITIIIGGGGALLVDDNDWGFAYMMLSISIVMTPYLRYLVMADKDYHYRLITEGLIVIYQDAIPEIAYKIVRGLAWLGVLVCVMAVAVLGPLSLVGAGGMALFAIFFTDFKKEESVEYTLFNKNKANVIKVVSNTAFVQFETIPFGYSGFASFYCYKNDLNKILSSLLPILNCREYREFKTILSLNRAPHSSLDVGVPRRLDELTK
ncbi:hypothetical protein [Aeromonas salmonicida]|uniref:hypothetical protein n=1 Tax=Aeromonas salmonicida TaxID=645 RepID=UPI0024A898A5|nr:hypothetical protein [Aeromonas salmonicida]MDM5136182.1 hypothetical protein [Aeromonas salmonicida]WHF39357.1 hypothetical protein QJ050_11090 [Aeromonas salmonicida]